MKIINKKIEELEMYDNNPRKNDEAVPYVMESIQKYGFKVPLVIDKNNVIVTGHTRYKASLKLGLKEVPCIVADDLTDEQIREFRLVDNKTSEYAEWDIDKLLVELEELDFSESSFSFNDDDDDDDDENEIIEDEFENVEVPFVKIGDIYQLGKHTLVCGDSTDYKNYPKNEKANLLLTDPPYNMGYQGAGKTPKNKRKQNVIKNDHMPEDEFEKFLTDILKVCNDFLIDESSFYIFYKELGFGTFIKSVLNAGLTFKQQLIWVKNNIVLGGNKYQNQYEPCLFGCKGKRIGTWNNGRKERSVIEEIDFMSEDELKQTIKDLIDDSDIVREKKNNKNDLHPTMKPIKLLAKFIKNSSNKDDLVLDIFWGSGSTLIACEQLDRRCHMIEFDEKHASTIIKRWEDFTGKKAIKVS